MEATGSGFVKGLMTVGLLVGIAGCGQLASPPQAPAPPTAREDAPLVPMPDSGNAEIVALRQDRMRRVQDRLEALSQLARDNVPPETNRARLQEHLGAVEELASDLPGLFPRGSGGPPSQALAEVWARPEEFKLAAAEFRRRVEAFAEVARAGDAGRTRQAFRELDLAQACDACHTLFRKGGSQAPRATGGKAP